MSELENKEQGFLNDYSSNQKLNEAVIEQMGGFESFAENAPDISNHGIDGGFGGFIYYSDTVSFAQDNREVILDALKEDAQEFGHESVPEMMANWKSLDGFSQDEIAEALYSNDESHEAHTSVYNAMAWYAGEKASYEYVNAMDDLEREHSKEYEFDSLGDAVVEHYAGDKLENPIYELEDKLNDLNISVIDIEVDQDDKSLTFTATNLFESPETSNLDISVSEDGISVTNEAGKEVQFTLEETDNVSSYIADNTLGKEYEMQVFSGENLDKLEQTFQSRDVDAIMDQVNQLENGNEVYIHHGDEAVAYISIDAGEAKAQFVESDKAEHAGLFNALESQSKEMEFFHLEVKDDTKQEMKQDSKGMELD